jgi:hypothetical protein
MNPQKQICHAIENRLIDKIPAANRNTLGWDDQPVPKDEPPSHQFFNLCMDDGRFDPEWGGSTCSFKEHTAITVCYMRRMEIDDAKKLAHIVWRHDDSMADMKLAILNALIVDYTETDPIGNPDVYAKHPWTPTDDTGRRLSDQLHPGPNINPKRHQNWPFLYQYIEFNFTLNWNL